MLSMGRVNGNYDTYRRTMKPWRINGQGGSALGPTDSLEAHSGSALVNGRLYR